MVRIRIGFTPDEEVGAGADHFDVKLFGADYAYTVDGGALGELEYENFNAAGAKLHVYGRSVHPGSAKGKMKNAILIAQEFQKLLPVEQNPMYTEGYEGFFHLDALSGNVEETTADYIIRDHNRQLFEQKKELFMSCADFLNRKYGEGTVVVDVKDSYYNMREIMEQHMHLIDNAKAAMEELGIEPKAISDPRRYRWSQTVLYGAALSEPVHRWRELPRQIRVRLRTVHGEDYGTADRHCSKICESIR